MNLVTDPRTIAISDGDSDASYSGSSYTSRSSMDDLLERALLHGFENVDRDNRISPREHYATSRTTLPHAFDQVNIFQRPRRADLPGSGQRGLRQRVDVHVDSHAPSGAAYRDDEASDALVRRAEYAQREATSMERFRQTLEAMRAREFGSDGCNKSATMSANGDDQAHRTKKKRRVPDQSARARLVAYNASMKAKQQEKYADRVAREAAEQLAHRPPRVSEAARRTGQRLHSQAKVSARLNSERREALQKEQETAEEKACTFEPTITAYARRLAEKGGYIDPEERQEQEAMRREALQRQRLEKEAAATRACSFRPTLAPHTQELIAARREASRSRSRSRRRREPDDQPGRVEMGASSHEPFEAGERLYREGGERLLRRQIRQRLAERQAETDRVGQNVLLSERQANHVTSRLEAWQRAKERNLAFMRENAQHISSTGACSSRPLSRSQSEALTERLCAPKRTPPVSSTPSAAAASSRATPARGSGTGGRTFAGAPPRRAASAGTQTTTGAARPAVRGANGQPVSRPLSRSSSHPISAQSDRGRQSSSRRSSPLRETSTFRGRWNPDALTPEQVKLQREFRRIRFGALFYKYAPTPSSETLCCRDVRKQVRLYYPEDAGIAEAVRLSVSGELVLISKSAFVAALERYESTHGPQPWGRTEKDKLLFPMAAGAALRSEAATPKAARAASARSAGSARLERQSSAPLPSRGGSTASAPKRTSTSTQARATPAESARGDYSRRGSVGAASRTSSATTRTHTSCPTKKLPRHISRGELEQCTFQPKLSAQTQRLSALDKQRRASYAAERDLRLRELQLLRARKAPGRCTGSPSVEPGTVAPSPAATTPTAVSLAPPPPLSPHAPRIVDNQLVSGAGRSPSVELSSLSGSSPSSQERSAAAIAAVVARRSEKATNAATPTSAPPAPHTKARATDAARRELEVLLSGYNKGTFTEPAKAAPVAPRPPLSRAASGGTESGAPRPSTGFASEPKNALLCPEAAQQPPSRAAKPHRHGEAAPELDAASSPVAGVSPNRCEVDDLYNALYKRSWF